MYLNIHFSFSVYIYWITGCCYRTNRGKQQFKHFSRRLNMGSKICYNLHNYSPLWKMYLFLVREADNGTYENFKYWKQLSIFL